jgi:mannosyltransferase OCH1-like enzyme
MTIPHTIHQTWASHDMPEQFTRFSEGWCRHHPDWEYRFYDDAACREVVAESFPRLLQLYDSCPYAVQRADIFRYLVVARQGGLYADMDMECVRCVEPLLEGRRAVFGVEDVLSERTTRRLGFRHRERIANFIFAAEPGHPVFGEIILRLQALPGRWDMEREVLETTGPVMLTDVVQEHRAELDLTVLPRDRWAPHDLWPLRLFPFDRHVYARHHFVGSWKHGFSVRAGRPA